MRVRPDGDRVAVEQRCRLNMMAFDVHAVGGVQVAGDDGVAVVGDVELLHVTTGDAGVVDDDVAIRTTADDGLSSSVSRYWCSPIFQHRAILGLRVGRDRHGVALHGFAGKPVIALGKFRTSLRRSPRPGRRTRSSGSSHTG